MQPKSHRNELHNNYIKGLFKNNNQEDESKLESTNNALLISSKEFILNKKIIKGQQSQFSNKNSKSNSSLQEDEELVKKRNEWKKNILKITSNFQERKIIYSLEPEDNDDSLNKNKNTIFAYKDNGFYAIYKYINSHNNYDKEIKARLKWNFLSNKFKVFDNKNRLIEEINYNLNFKGWSGPTKLRVIIHENNIKWKINLLNITVYIKLMCSISLIEKLFLMKKIYKLFLLKMKGGIMEIKMIYYYNLLKRKIMNIF